MSPESRPHRRVRPRKQRPLPPPQWPYVLVDTARVLLVDPCRLPPSLVRRLVAERLAVLVEDAADGPAFVRIRPGGASLSVSATCEWQRVVPPEEADDIILGDEK